MIPLMVVVGFRRYGRRGFRLWIPLFLIWLLLLPLVLLLVPLVIIGLAVVQVNPFRALATGWRILAGLKGTNIEVEDGNALILIRIF